MVKRALSIIMAAIMAFGTMTGNVDTAKYITGMLTDQGLLGYKYDFDGHYFYTSDNAWQGVFGFNDLYDAAAPLVVMFYDTVRFHFNYADKDWRIQLWKGQYGWVFIGAEMGLYTKPTRRPVEQYDRAGESDWIPMSFKLTRFGFWKLLETEHRPCWWSTGFIPGSLVIMNYFKQLQMECRITARDTEMLNAICSSMAKEGQSYTVEGLDILLKF